MKAAILGTAGHIDHGKTALIRALTGVDTDRLKEEKERGITIELGFAELGEGEALHVGVVDVPGHEDFVRTMVAGATGMDVVLLVVAADEGVMPQTLEHLAIVGLLGVPGLVVALTKVDLVEEDWLELVDAEVRELLEDTPWSGAPRIATSAETGRGLDELRGALHAAAEGAAARRGDDLARLPVDRVFTVRGTGTVVTGSLWSGTLEDGATVRVLPGGEEARIRGLQVHGRDAERVEAGHRTAVALTGDGSDRERLGRGAALVAGEGWRESWMLTVRARMLPETPWILEHNQRVRVHVGTGEVMARCVRLEAEGPLAAGEEGWVQLRLEKPTVARARDRLVLRSYSPMATIGGGEVAEPAPDKRSRTGPEELEALTGILDGDAREAVSALARLAGWRGVAVEALPVLAGLPPAETRAAAEALASAGALEAGGRIFHPRVVADARTTVADAVAQGHRRAPLRPSVGLDVLRASLPSWAHPPLADAVIEALEADGSLELTEGGARTPGFVPSLTDAQARAVEALRDVYAEAGLAPPGRDELPEALATRDDLDALLGFMEARGSLRSLGEDFLVWADALAEAEALVVEELGGRTELGPADFREALPVTRRHLMPLLAHMDGAGITVRRGGVRDVPEGP